MLKWSKRIVVGLWLCLMLILGAWIFVENPSEIEVTLFVFTMKNVAVGHLICSMLFLGGLLGWLTSSIMYGSKNYGHKRRVKKANKEIEKLKSLQETP